jgi:hypothetical protein
MNRLTLFILQIFLVAVTTLTASHWKSSTQTAGAAQAQTASAGKAAEGANTLGADQANKATRVSPYPRRRLTSPRDPAWPRALPARL